MTETFHQDRGPQFVSLDRGGGELEQEPVLFQRGRFVELVSVRVSRKRQNSQSLSDDDDAFVADRVHQIERPLFGGGPHVSFVRFSKTPVVVTLTSFQTAE